MAESALATFADDWQLDVDGECYPDVAATFAMSER